MPTPDNQNPYQPPSPGGAEGNGFVAPSVVPEQLRWTGYGLRVVEIGMLLILLAVTISILDFASAALTVTALLTVGLLLVVAGQLMCMTVPSATGARSVAILAAICQLTGLMTVAAEALFGLPLGNVGGLRLTTLAAVILMLAFMRRLAEFLQRPRLQHEATYLIYSFWGIIATALTFAIASAVFAFEDGPAANLFFGAFSSILGIAAIVFVVAYAHLVTALRRVIGIVRSPHGADGGEASSGA